jgi:pyruvate dehydrogenase E2 component (dihydrolipoamide acetyltransferase)
MSVSVFMPQLGESVTEGTVTRWLKKEGEQVTADEPLLEVSTDKVDTEIPSPASGILRGIVVDEDETVAVGAQLAVIEDGAAAPAPAQAPAAPEAAAPAPAAPAPAPAPAPAAPAPAPAAAPAPAYEPPAAYAPSVPSYAPPASPAPVPSAASSAPTNGGPGAPPSAWSWSQPPAAGPAYAPPPPPPAGYSRPAQAAAPAPAPASAPAQPAEAEPAGAYPEPTPLPSGESPYVTPLVRKLASEHGVTLESIAGSGVGGRIRKQDVLEAAGQQRAAEEAAAAAAAAAAAVPAATTTTTPAATTTAAAPAGAPEAAPAAAARPAVVPSALRGTTQRMSRPRQVIAKRMVESLQTAAQLTTVVEADVTNIARLRDRAKAAFETREGVKLTFLPFFAQATVEALKMHPKLNAVIDTEKAEITYHAAEHLGIAVDTERGLMVPVIHSAGDLNIGGLARQIADVAARTRSGHVGPDELAGGTFTLTNTGSRGALFDTPILNLPQVGILGFGGVVKRAVVVDDPALGEVIAVRSMVYLALTYDHRLVDGADAARFLVTVKNRLEEGSFEAELGL